MCCCCFALTHHVVALINSPDERQSYELSNLQHLADSRATKVGQVRSDQLRLKCQIANLTEELDGSTPMSDEEFLRRYALMPTIVLGESEHVQHLPHRLFIKVACCHFVAFILMLDSILRLFSRAIDGSSKDAGRRSVESSVLIRARLPSSIVLFAVSRKRIIDRL